MVVVAEDGRGGSGEGGRRIWRLACRFWRRLTLSSPHLVDERNGMKRNGTQPIWLGLAWLWLGLNEQLLRYSQVVVDYSTPVWKELGARQPTVPGVSPANDKKPTCGLCRVFLFWSGQLSSWFCFGEELKDKESHEPRREGRVDVERAIVAEQSYTATGISAWQRQTRAIEFSAWASQGTRKKKSSRPPWPCWIQSQTPLLFLSICRQSYGRRRVVTCRAEKTAAMAPLRKMTRIESRGGLANKTDQADARKPRKGAELPKRSFAWPVSKP